MKRREIREGQFVNVRMSQRDRRLLEDLVAGDPEYVTRLRAVPGKSHFVGDYTLDDLEDMLGHIAAEANHTDDHALQIRLDALYDRLLKVQRSYDDGNWNDSAACS